MEMDSAVNVPCLYDITSGAGQLRSSGPGGTR
jgi:hypothetical protein